MYRIKCAAFTHPGKVRENNEDNFYAAGKWRQNIENGCYAVLETVKNEKLTLAVCDGMGGQELGEMASLIAVETLDSFIKKEGLLTTESLHDYVQSANDAICRLMEKEKKRIGSTMAVLQFSGQTVLAANIGDSRIYHCKENKLEQISYDHTVVGRMIRMGQLTKEEAKLHPNRHQITQYLGIFPDEMILEAYEKTDENVSIGDKYLLCSDGLTDMLTDEQIEEILNRKEPVEELARSLVQAAIDAGGKDNVTVVVAEICKKRFLF